METKTIFDRERHLIAPDGYQMPLAITAFHMDLNVYDMKFCSLAHNSDLVSVHVTTKPSSLLLYVHKGTAQGSELLGLFNEALHTPTEKTVEALENYCLLLAGEMFGTLKLVQGFLALGHEEGREELQDQFKRLLGV